MIICYNRYILYIEIFKWIYLYLILEEIVVELKKFGFFWCEEWIGFGLIVVIIRIVIMDCFKYFNFLIL